MSATSIVFIVGALLTAAVGINFARDSRVSLVVPTLFIGLALCACIEVGRRWTA